MVWSIISSLSMLSSGLALSFIPLLLLIYWKNLSLLPFMSLARCNLFCALAWVCAYLLCAIFFYSFLVIFSSFHFLDSFLICRSLKSSWCSNIGLLLFFLFFPSHQDHLLLCLLILLLWETPTILKFSSNGTSTVISPSFSLLFLKSVVLIPLLSLLLIWILLILQFLLGFIIFKHFYHLLYSLLWAWALVFTALFPRLPDSSP